MADWIRKIGMVPALAVMAACGGESGATAEESSAPAQPVAAEAPATEQGLAPAPGGEVIEVRMTMANGGRFEPSEVTANPGDVIRFVNVDNVHNVSFPADRNSGAANLPAPSPYLTAPGQTYEMAVDLAPGTYTFQCDPHVPMGMLGTLTVQ